MTMKTMAVTTAEVVVRAKQQESTGKICVVDVRAARITSEQLACAETEIGDLAAGKESR
jgi:hypothetical protein